MIQSDGGNFLELRPSNLTRLRLPKQWIIRRRYRRHCHEDPYPERISFFIP
jgi:hypothetical protein